VRRNALADRIGGLLMIGFEGTVPADIPAELIAGAAGAILFQRNLVDPAQARALTDAIRTLQPPAAPPLIAVDQEGGPVSRLAEFGTALPSAMALGATGQPTLTRDAYRIIGEELAALGFNTNFAPVADVNDEIENPVIGARSFGDEPARVAKHVAAAIHGLHDAGIAATAKHFPGHGSTRADSHEELPVLEHDIQRLRAVELAPFRAAIDARVDIIMTGHIAFPAVDDSGTAATQSKRLVTDLLRGELGFDGLVCTDDLNMKAVETGSAALRALKAGTDLLVVSTTAAARSGLAALRSAVDSGELDEAAVEGALARIDRLRRRFTAPAAANLASIGSAAHRAAALNIARRAIRVVRDPRRAIPLALSPGKRLLVVNFGAGPKSSARQTSGLSKALSRGAARVQEQIREPDPAGHAYKQLLMAATRADAIIAVTRSLARHPLQARAIGDLAMLGKPLVVVAAAEPHDAALAPNDVAVIAAYGDDDSTMQAVAEVLLGDVSARAHAR